MKSIKIFIVFTIFTIFVLNISFADTVVIVNTANSVSSLSKSKISKIYKLKMSSWANGDIIEVLNLPVKDLTRKDFSKSALRKTPNLMKKYYLKQVLSGKGQPPKILKTQDEMKKYVSENKNAIGYIDKSAVDSSVKSFDIN